MERDGQRQVRSAGALGAAATRRRVAGIVAALALGGGLRSPSRAAQEATSAGVCPPTTPEENKQLVERYWAEVWTGANVAALDDLFAADEVHHWGIGDDTVGAAAFGERIVAFQTAFPDFAIRVDQLVAEGDQVVSQWTATGTHEGTWLGVPATGNRVEYTGANLFRIACGRIAESWGEADHLGLLRQLGGLHGVATPTANAPDAALAAASPAAASPAACPAQTPEANRAVVRRWFADAVNPRDLALLDEIVAPDAVLHATGFPDAVGPAAMAGLFRALFAGFHDLRFAVEAGPAEGDLVVERWTATGFNDGAFQNLPPTHRVLSWTGINVYRVACGRIVEIWTEADTLGRLRQLGGLPALATPVAG